MYAYDILIIVNISLLHTPFYYQSTLHNKHRHTHIETEFTDVPLIRVHAPTPKPLQQQHPSEEKITSGALAQLRIIDMALRKQDRKKPFQPFALIEDDVSKYRAFPKTLSVPDDTDMLYIGISKASTIEYPPYYVFKNFGYEISTHPYMPIVRIHHMLSTHGMLFCSLRACVFHNNAILESIHQKLNYDVILARTQSAYNIYALKEPLIYQDSRVGGLEESSKITLHALYSQKLTPSVDTVTKHCSNTL